MSERVSVEIVGETLVLLPQRAVYWPRREMLLIADAHWGKDAAWRSATMPIPVGSLADDLVRLSLALDETQAKRLVVLGDLLHAKRGRAADVIAQVGAWREAHGELSIVLVRGNHDVSAGDPPESWGIEVVNGPLIDAPFALMHDAAPTEAGYALGGHIHPGVLLKGKGGERLMLPCFWFGEEMGVLPAFGGLTGLVQVRPAPDDKIYVVVDNEVIRTW